MNLGKLPGQQSMLVFHALARMGYEGLVVVSPSVPLVSVGYFQDAAKEVDLDYCREHGIPVMRREVGGGATYLDGDQIFYQLIWKRGNPLFPVRVADIFETLSQPACDTYGDFGIKTRFQPGNDIVTESKKKIAGEGGGDNGDSMVVVGGILMDFDYETMSKILKVPDEKFRDKIHKSMEENLTTMRRELGDAPPGEDVVRALIGNFERMLGRLEPVEMGAQTVEKMVELERWFTSDEFLHRKTPRIPDGVKIRDGVEILYSVHKAEGGLIRTAQEIRSDVIDDIVISGDFQLFPKSRLSSIEEGVKHNRRDGGEIESALERVYDENKIESPGVKPRDIKDAIMEAERA
jgi:lipoate-protein ligase A